MKVLVATAQTQGARDNDYNWCIEGELVRIGEVCAWDRADPDGGCGCGRGFGGLNSHRATTTAMVADTSLSRAEYGGGRPVESAAAGMGPVRPRRGG